MDARFFSENKSITFFDHTEHLTNIVKFMEQSTIQSNDADGKNAHHQLLFAKEALRLSKKMLGIPRENLIEKRNVGIKLCEINAKFFGKNEIPTIQGEKSKAFAALLAKHFRDLAKVQFDKDEISWSDFFSKVPLINIRSIDQQIKHHCLLANRIDEQIKVYEEAYKKKGQAVPLAKPS